jgi:hypothetical protein
MKGDRIERRAIRSDGSIAGPFYAGLSIEEGGRFLQIYRAGWWDNPVKEGYESPDGVTFLSIEVSRDGGETWSVD